MEFFIALFGGIFLIIKAAGHSIKERRYAAERNEWESRVKPLKSILLPTNEDRDALREMESWPAEDLYAYLAEDLMEIFGENYKAAVPFEDARFRCFHSETSPYYYRSRARGAELSRSSYMNYWTTHLLFSKRGKSVAVWSPGLIVSAGNPTVNLRWCKRIEKNLQMHGCPVHLELAYENMTADPTREVLTGHVMIREAQFGSWHGAPLESILEIRANRTDVP